MSKKKEIQKNNPDNADALMLAELYDDNHDIKAFADLPGGKKLADMLTQEVVSSVNRIVSDRSKLTLTDYQTLAADLSANLRLLRMLQNAKENETILEEQIADALAS